MMIVDVRRVRNRRAAAATGATWLALLLLVLSKAAVACNVPVFRYALDRWAPDAYEVVIFHRGPIAADHLAFVDALEKTASNALANLTVERMDLDSDAPSPLRALWQGPTNTASPWLLVRYPSSVRAEQPVWAGPPGAEILKTLVDSPSRREIVRRLAKGDSAVWLLLESGQPERDNAVTRMLEAESRNLEKTLQLPEPAPDDPKMQADLPLKIAFSTVRVSRTDPAERMLVNQLLRLDPDYAAVTGPMVYGVFGRGRALPPLRGKQLSAEILHQVAEFIAGPCSCEVKSMNPGFELLVAADWDALLEGRVVKDPELPSLIGLSQFAPPTNQAPVTLAAADVAAESSPGRPLLRNLLLVLGVAALALIVVTLTLRARGTKPPQA